VCEDNPLLRSVVGGLVAAHGWATVEASTASDAIRQATALHPDLVLLDIDLVGMSGLESIPRVRAGCPEARVVAMCVGNRGFDLCLGVGACAVVSTTDLDQLESVLAGLEACEAA